MVNSASTGVSLAVLGLVRRAQLSGDLTHKTVVDVLPQGLALLQQAGDEWTVNLQGAGGPGIQCRGCPAAGVAARGHRP